MFNQRRIENEDRMNLSVTEINQKKLKIPTKTIFFRETITSGKVTVKF